MSEQRKQRLIDLGAEVLAEALLELADRYAAVDDLVERKIATPKDNVQRFKAKLSGLKRSRRFIDWRESSTFARNLQDLLQDLQAGVDDPRLGAQLVAAFYETDQKTFDRCDDSNGYVGDIYRYHAKELFLGYACRCTDKEWLVDLLYGLIQLDDYVVRDALIYCAAEFLPEPHIRAMIADFQKLADKETDEYDQRKWLGLIESLARQIKDAPLFERVRLASWDEVSTAACMDIGRVYLECDDEKTALRWLKRIPPAETFQADERDQLLLDIYARLGDGNQQAAIAWQIFRRSRSGRSLAALLSVVGADQRVAVVAGETSAILAEPTWSSVDATFLVETGCLDEAEGYLLERVAQLNGDYYYQLLPLAEVMEAEERALVATVLYRALLDSILQRAQTKTYPHGVRYLKKLDRLAMSVADWQAIEDHGVYREHLQQQHGRKRSFWARYGA
ncbi:MAG: hypothetical protein K8R55_02025 [Desulfuromonadaceae bacterium]|nr:hypothetical protein [Desulfuromonadaceae bacterium]